MGNATKMTMGKLLLQAATGEIKERRTVSPEDAEAIRRNIADSVKDKIEAIRKEQRKALEDSRNVVVM
jgi:hypothetical protein